MIGIVFATRREAAPFLRVVAQQELEPAARQEELAGGLETYQISLDGTEPDAVVLVSGMGPEAAARATAALVEIFSLSRVVNAGICGAVATGIEVGAIFRVAQVRCEPLTTADEHYPCCRDGWEELPEERLTTCVRPVFEDQRRTAIATWGGLVDMEGAAVAQVAHRHGIPCHLIKAVSDLADEQGRESVKRTIDSLSARLAELLCRELPRLEPSAGSPGLAAEPGLIRRMLDFVKVEHTIFSLPLLLAGAWLGAGRRLPEWQVLLLVMVAGTGARTVGMAMNRIIDRRLDALNPRTAGRELPSGRLTVGNAWVVAGSGLVVYLVACVLLGPICLVLSPVPLVPLVLYSYLKRFTSLCHFGIGICLGLAPLAAFVAVSGGVRFDGATLLLALFTFCWISGFDIVYALQDIESDRSTGVRSLPAVLGWRGAGMVAAGVHAIAFIAVLGVLLLTGGGWPAATALVVATGSLVLAHLPLLPLPVRFFPLTAIAGVAAALVPLLGGMR